MNMILNDSGTYPSERVDLTYMNRVLRHRLRNLCCGMKMALEQVSDKTKGSHPTVEDNFLIMRSELDGLLTFTQRMDLLFDKLPMPVPMSFYQLATQCKLDLGDRAPKCKLKMAAPDLELKIMPGSLIHVALNELLVNAAEAAPDDKVSLKWTHGKGLKFIIENATLPSDINMVSTPPRPFVTHRGRHEGLGMAIVQRIADAIGGSFKFKRNSTTGKSTASIRIPVRHLQTR